MKWIYRVMVFIVATVIFSATYYVNIKGVYRGNPALAPFAPFMTAGMYLICMRMVTENVECYKWKILLATISLLLVGAVFI